jgi:hypothetical protein
MLEEAGWVDRDGDGIRELDAGPTYGRLYGSSADIAGWPSYVLGWPACGADALQAATVDACGNLSSPEVFGLEWIFAIREQHDLNLRPVTDDQFANCVMVTAEGEPISFLSISRHLVDLAEAQEALDGAAARGCVVTSTTFPGADVAAFQVCPTPASTGLFVLRDGVGTLSLVLDTTPEAQQRVIDLTTAVRDSLDQDADGAPSWYDDDVDGDGILNIDDPDADGDGIFNSQDRNPWNPLGS